MFEVSPANLQTFIDTPKSLLEDRVHYNTFHIPNVFCDGHLQLINCVGIFRIHWVFHRTPEKKSGRERSEDLGGQTVLEMILSANTSSKIAIDMWAVWAIAPSLKVGFVNCIFSKLLNEVTRNNVTVPLGVESLREKNVSEYALRNISTQTPIFPSYFSQIYKIWERLKKHHWKIRITTCCVLV